MHIAPASGPVVVGVDGSEPSRSALRWACAEAACRGTHVEAVFAVPDRTGLAPGYVFTELGLRAEGDRLLRHVMDDLAATDVEVRPVVRFGSAVTELRAHVEESGASLLALGRRGSSRLAHLLVGSVASALVQEPPAPVAIVPTDLAWGAHRRVAVGVDGSADAQQALAWAVEEGRVRDAEVEVVVAWSIPHLDLLPLAPPASDEPALRHRAREILDAAIRDAGDAGGAKVEGRLAKQDPTHALLSAAEGADVVVVGTRGLGAIRQRVLGSTSHGLLHRCPSTLVIVPTAAAPAAGDQGDA